MSMIHITDLDLKGKRVLIREDLNAPLQHGRVSSDQRVRASLPTIEYAMKAGAQVMVMSHLGRPEEGRFSAESSLRPVAETLSLLLRRRVPLIADYLDHVPRVAEGDVVLLENVRFNAGEKKNAEALARKYAALCDIYGRRPFAASGYRRQR